MMTRRFAISSTIAAALATLNRHAGFAQFTTQDVSNGVQITATGNVDVSQAASGSQEVGVLINGRIETGDGIFRTTTGQVVRNDGQIVATGDVTLTQSASGQQTVYAEQTGGGVNCSPGQYRQIDRCTVEFCTSQCDWVTFSCPDCRSRCKGRC